MNHLNSASLILSRPDWLRIYAQIIDRLEPARDWPQPEDLASESLMNGLNPCEIAYLQQGEIGVIQLVCFELTQMGFIRVRERRLETVTYFSHTSHLEPIEQAIFDLLHTPQTLDCLLTDRDLRQKIAQCCEPYRQSLITSGYIREPKKSLAAGLGGILLLGLIFGKPLVGMLAGYRYLLLLVGAAMPKASLAIATTAWLSKKSKSSSQTTVKGKAYLAKLKRKYVETAPELPEPPVKPERKISLFLALSDFATLRNTKIEAYEDLFHLFSTG